MKVVSIEVTNGGSGYTAPPAVDITGGGGSEASAQALVARGKVTAVEVIEGGSEYTSPPDVQFAGGGGAGASATAILG